MPCQSRTLKSVEMLARYFGGWMLAWLLLLAVGCSALTENGGPLSSTFRSAQHSEAEEERHREKYQEDRDPESFRWLMRHCVNSGMGPAEIGKVLGERGERIDNDTWLKKGNGNYQQSDVTYKWGPDRTGHSAMLVFRDGKLIEFDPTQY